MLIVMMLPLSALSTTFQVENNNDTGPGSLRQAILDANADPAYPHTISFATFTGATTIVLLEETLKPLRYPTVVDATTHPGYSGVPIIKIQDIDFTPTGLTPDPNITIFTISATVLKVFCSQNQDLLSVEMP